MKYFTGIVIMLAVLAGFGAYFYFSAEYGSNKNAPQITIEVKRGSLVQNVSLNGTVEPAEKVELSFDRTGKIARVFTDVGALVKTGEILAALDNADIRAGVLRAEADLDSEKARLAELERGARTEDLKIADVKVENARQALLDAQSDSVNKIMDAYTKSDDAVRNRLDKFIDNPRGSNPGVTIAGGDSQLKHSVESNRVLLETLLTQWFVLVNNLDVNDDIYAAAKTSYANISSVRAILSDAAAFLDGLSVSVNITQATLDGYRTDVGLARASVESAVINLRLSEEKFNNANSLLKLAEEERTKMRAGFSKEEIASQAARVKRSEAELLRIQADLAKTILRSPVAGVVSRFSAKTGQSIAPGQIIAAVIGTVFEIKVNIPEADIAKVKISNEALVTLDAYGPEVIFEARLVEIEPAETVVEGIATYKATFQFKIADERIKSGLSANINIVTAKKDNILIVPQRMVIKQGENRLVYVLDENNEPQERAVKTGLLGSNGFIEVLEGLEEGEKLQQ